MSKEVITQLRDDLDKSIAKDVASHTFAIDGDSYEIELSKANYTALKKMLNPYIAVARSVKSNGVKPKKASGKMGKIRAWAKNHGYEVGSVGRLPQEVLKAYARSTHQSVN